MWLNKNSQRWYFAWENLQWGFCDVGCNLYFVAVFHLLMFFIHIFFSTSSLTLPWTIARFLDPFCTFSPAHRRVIRDTFFFNHSVIFLSRVLRFWVGIFYPQAFFTLRSFTDIFGTFCDSDAGRNTPSRTLISVYSHRVVPSADAWTWTTHIVVTRPLIYQLSQ